MSNSPTTLPPDDSRRQLTLANGERDSSLPHIGMAGDTYTITISGKDTAGQFCIMDIHIPHGGGPPHRHNFEETFIVLEGEVEASVRGQKTRVRRGDTVNIPANAPHQFRNVSPESARLLCICSPSGQEEFFVELGVSVATRTTPPPELDHAQQLEFIQKAKALAPRYKTEFLDEA